MMVGASQVTPRVAVGLLYYFEIPVKEKTSSPRWFWPGSLCYPQRNPWFSDFTDELPTTGIDAREIADHC